MSKVTSAATAIAVMDASSNVTSKMTGSNSAGNNNGMNGSHSANNNNTRFLGQSNSKSSLNTMQSGPLLKWRDMEHLVAGISGGVLSTLVLHPLDLIKIRFQVNEGTGVTARPNYTSFFHAIRSIVFSQGFTGLYQGVSANCVGAGMAWGIYFFAYNYVKNRMQAGDKKVKLPPTSHVIAAGQAGVLSLLVVNPVFVAKTRLCLQYEETKDASKDTLKDVSKKIRYRGLGDALVKIFQQEGVRGFYKGFIPGVFGVSHGVIQFVTYEEMKSMYNRYHNRSSENTLKSHEYVAFAAASKMLAASFTYPYQVVRSRLQDQHTSYANCRDVILKIWRNEGKLRGLYKGFPVYMVHVTPNICIVLLVYEYFTAMNQTSPTQPDDDWKT